MTSKEAIERLSKYNNHYIEDKEYLFLDIKSEEWKAIVEDLEHKELLEELLESELKLEKDKVKYVMKQLEKQDEILEILKKWFMQHITDYIKYDNSLFVDTFIRDDEPIFKILKQWLEKGDKNE